MVKIFNFPVSFGFEHLLYEKKCFFSILAKSENFVKTEFSKIFRLIVLRDRFFEIENFYWLNQQISGVSFELAGNFS